MKIITGASDLWGEKKKKPQHGESEKGEIFAFKYVGRATLQAIRDCREKTNRLKVQDLSRVLTVSVTGCTTRTKITYCTVSGIQSNLHVYR